MHQDRQLELSNPPEAMQQLIHQLLLENHKGVLSKDEVNTTKIMELSNLE